MEKQICSNCKKEKPIVDFFFRDKLNDRRHEQCKKCLAQKRRSKEHYVKYKAEYILRAKNRKLKTRNQNRINLIEYLKTHPCIVCGETNPVVLEFDHKNQDEKVIEICKMIGSHNWETIIKEIAKCDVLCANHHKIRTSKQLGWFYETIERKAQMDCHCSAKAV